MAEGKYLAFTKDPAREILHDWWKDIDRHRGDRALLRRCRHPGEVVFYPSFHRLRHRLADQELPLWNEALAAVAGLAAHVKKIDSGRMFAQQMAAPRGPKQGAIVSGLRFRRLLQRSELDDLYQPLIRAIRHLGGEINLFDLAHGVYWWRFDNTKKEWAYAYYEAAPKEN